MNQSVASAVLASVLAQFREEKVLGEKAIAQCADEVLTRVIAPGSNSIAVIVKHLHGNMRSRWTDFLTSDGEKPSRQRDTEFMEDAVSRDQVMTWWEDGWGICLDTVSSLTADDLARTVTIRGKSLSVVEALHRQLTHYGYHVGQIVLLAKAFRGDAWSTLSIPRGRSSA